MDHLAQGELRASSAAQYKSDIRNHLSGYVIIEAADIDAAAAMFKDHPHFTIFPGDGVEVMPVLAIPGAP